MRSEIASVQTFGYLGLDQVIANNLPEPKVTLAGRGYDADRIRKNMNKRDILP
jgi:hypothetical protein